MTVYVFIYLGFIVAKYYCKRSICSSSTPCICPVQVCIQFQILYLSCTSLYLVPDLVSVLYKSVSSSRSCICLVQVCIQFQILYKSVSSSRSCICIVQVCIQFQILYLSCTSLYLVPDLVSVLYKSVSASNSSPFITVLLISFTKTNLLILTCFPTVFFSDLRI